MCGLRVLRRCAKVKYLPIHHSHNRSPMTCSKKSTANAKMMESVTLTKIDSSNQPYKSTCAIMDMVPAITEIISANCR